MKARASAAGSCRAGVHLAQVAMACLGSAGAWANPEDLAPTGSPEVFAEVSALRQELEQIRFVMGRRLDERPAIAIEGAAPREVYFQARSLFRKADQLGFELLGERVQPPGAIAGREPVPKDVLAVVSASRGVLGRVRADLGIGGRVDPAEPDPGKTPTDVYRAIVSAKRQFTLLLNRREPVSFNYSHVTVAISYASALLSEVPGVTRIPEPPELVPGANPADAHRALLSCFSAVEQIAGAGGLKVLKLKAPDYAGAEFTPSDVADLSTLLVAELAYLHRHRPGLPPPHPPYFPGRKFPSHVVQRAAVLEAQLLQLLAHLEANPGWFRSGEGGAP